jgi:hypothetical protein
VLDDIASLCLLSAGGGEDDEKCAEQIVSSGDLIYFATPRACGENSWYICVTLLDCFFR